MTSVSMIISRPIHVAVNGNILFLFISNIPLYVCMHMYIYIHVHIYTYMCVYIYIYTYTYMYAGDGQGGLACCNSWVCKESDTTERLN